MSVLLIGCSNNEKTTTLEKLNEKTIAENNTKMESEKNSMADIESNRKSKVTKLSDEELISKKGQYESRLHDFLNNFSGGFYTADIRQFEHYKQNYEFKEYVDMLLALGYGIEQAEGYYYLYVGEPVGYQDGSEPASSDNNALIETNNKNYYKYESNANVRFDIDGDGSDEQVVYDTVNGKLKILGYEAIDIDTMFAETDYFVIVKFSDKFDNKMNMIGILDQGPSNDYTTKLYSIIEPMGEKVFVSVGSVPGKIVTPSEYDEKNISDFNYKAVLYEGRGIEAPVRLSLLANLQTWFGRNMFTYYTTYSALIDNINKYEIDYETRVELNVEKNVVAYREKDLSSDRFIIKSGQKVYLLATDNEEWISMLAKDETMGWVNAKDVTESNFSGFPVFD